MKGGVTNEQGHCLGMLDIRLNWLNLVIGGE